MSTPDVNDYFCETADVLQRISRIDPQAYDRTRNHLSGKVSWLSPFLTHGITNTREIADKLLERQPPENCYRFLYELGWREFFHRTWQIHGDAIFEDMRNPQPNAQHQQIPLPLLNAVSGIHVIDHSLEHLFSHGLMHNHARMWVAGIVCKLSKTHWTEAARWFHYHLLDGDLASNTLSWQWIAGTFSHKQYIANQANLNKYSQHQQHGSWLDVPYEAFEQFSLPQPMRVRGECQYPFTMPGKPIAPLQGTVALRSLWHLDPRWQAHIEQHILFIDSDWLARWPMSDKRWRFIEHWARQCKAQIHHGTLADLIRCTGEAQVVRQEYPACLQWPGQIAERDWLYPMPEKSFNSFSQFFKQVKYHVGL